jgi:type VI protein secretion system component VasK
MAWLWWLVGVLVLAVWVFTLWDVIRRADLSTGAKVGWIAAVVVFPVLGTIVYLIARPAAPDYAGSRSKPEDAARAAEEAEAAQRARQAEQQAPSDERFNIR